MTTQPPSIEEPQPPTQPAAQSVAAVQSRPTKQPRPPVRQVLRELHWRAIVPVGVALGVLWMVLLGGFPAFSVFASFLPVLAGLLIGRRIHAHASWHGVMLGIVATIAATATWGVFVAVQGLTTELIQYGTLIFGTVLPFTPLGVIVSFRSEQRARTQREEIQRRGGRLERPGRVRTLDDLQALSLLQLGGYVSDLFRKHGFGITEYRIEKERDRIEFHATHDGVPWLLRVTTGEKIKPGVAQELAQRMKAEGITKGVVVTSMDFQEPTVRWAKGKPVALIDGPTLLSMDD